jgi:PadR family transcriptional regulator PadR
MEKLKNFGFEDIQEGTIYPLLVRLEKKGLIFAEFRPSPLGPSRKYYFITKDGIETLSSFEAYWNSLSNTVKKIISLEGKQ